jgi:hypothetical protein
VLVAVGEIAGVVGMAIIHADRSHWAVADNRRLVAQKCRLPWMADLRPPPHAVAPGASVGDPSSDSETGR